MNKTKSKAFLFFYNLCYFYNNIFYYILRYIFYIKVNLTKIVLYNRNNEFTFSRSSSLHQQCIKLFTKKLIMTNIDFK